MGADQILDTLATSQHGVVARHQLLAAGMTPRMIERRRSTGRLMVVHPAVYRVRGHAETWPQRLLAAVLACESGAVVSHRGAAFLHGMPGIDARAEVTVTTGRGPRLVAVHRTRQPPRSTVLDGVPCTGAARTLVDLAAVVGPAVLERALDDALTRRLVTVAYVNRQLDELGRRGRPGAAVLGGLLAEREGAVERPLNRFERRLFKVLRAAGMPVPVPQYEIRLPNGRAVFVDFAYPHLRIALEADSYQHHSSKLDWERDRVRNRALAAMGWRVLPVTWGDLLRPAAFLAELCTADDIFGGPRCTLGA